MNVLIIPEDPQLDAKILKPIITEMLKAVGKPKARVRVCSNPRLRGVTEALKWSNIEKILKLHPQVNLFLLCVDRDGEAGRVDQLRKLEIQAKNLLDQTTKHFLAENAWQEIEVWALAGHTLPSNWLWQDIQNERDAKEAYFYPFIKVQGLEAVDLPLSYQKIANEAASRYVRIRQLCPQDIANLEQRIGTWLKAT